MKNFAMDNFVERRKFKRYPLYCPLQYKGGDRAPVNSSISVNISESGALISVDRPLSVMTSVIVRIFLAKEEFFIRARIVHVENVSEKGPYTAGLEFLDGGSAFPKKLYEELESIMSYQRHCSEDAGRAVSLAEASIKRGRNMPSWL